MDALPSEVFPPERNCKHFAIIGTREPDEAQSEVAYRIAWIISCLSHVVRTGAAYGIDQKAMDGTQGKNLHVYLPWDSYNANIVPTTATRVVYDPDIHGTWTASVGRFHPAANRLSRGAFALHARNFGIIEGCKGVLALPGEDGGGGTGQGIRIAKALRIPLVQGNKGSIDDVPRFIGRAMQQLGLADPNLRTTLQGR